MAAIDEKEWFIRDECGDLSEPMCIDGITDMIRSMEDGECLGEVECYNKVDSPTPIIPAGVPCTEEPK